MPFEPLPQEFEDFFSSHGELPPALAAEHATATPAPAPAPTPAPAVAEAPTPAPTPAPATQPVVSDPPAPPTTNPFLERLLAERENQLAAITKQVEELQAKITRASEPPAPDPVTDPLGHMTHTLAKLQQQLDAMQGTQKEAQQQTQQQMQQAQFMNMVNGQVNQFKASTPDYDDAYKHLINTRTQDFRDLGMTEQQVRDAIGQEEMTITKNALMMGKNPAELVYNFAKRYGYQPKVSQTADNKLAQIQKGIEASQTTQRATPPTAGEITTDNIREASEADINRMVATNWEGIFGLKKGVV